MDGINGRDRGLQTLESCQGESAGNSLSREMPAYVFFLFNDWQTISRFAFEVVSPALGKIDADTAVTVEVFNCSDPMGKIQIRSPSAIPAIAAALRKAIRRKSPCSDDKARKAPRNSTRHHSRPKKQPSCGGHAICLT